jgi:polar amino acid transport system substrate-binding protein
MRRVVVVLALAVVSAFHGCRAAKEIGGQRESGGLTLLTEEYAPLNFSVDGEVRGQAVDVVQALMQRLGVQCPIRVVTWEQGYRQVLEQADTALFSTVMTPERRDRLQWVGPVTALDTNLYARSGSGITVRQLADAKRAGTIAAVSEYYSAQVLRQEGFTNLRIYPDDETAVRALLAGDVELFVGSNVVLPSVLAEIGVSPTALESVFTVSTDLTYIAFSPTTSPRVVAAWQEALDAIKSEGSFAAIHARWFPGEMPPAVLQLVTEEYPPITFMRDGVPAGFVTDMVREIASQLGIPDGIRLSSWKNSYNMALLLFSAERTPEREDLFHWVGPVGRNGAVLYARKGSGIRVDSLDQAREVGAIATTTDWFTEQYLEEQGFTNLVSSKDPVENVRQLLNGEVELSVFTDITFPEIVREAGCAPDDFEPVFTVMVTDFYIAISRSTPERVVSEWRAQLEAMKRDGRFERIYRSYLPDVDLSGLLSEP